MDVEVYIPLNSIRPYGCESQKLLRERISDRTRYLCSVEITAQETNYTIFKRAIWIKLFAEKSEI